MLNLPTNYHAIVTGATSQIGRFLLPRLQAAKFTTIVAFSRQSHPNTNRIIWQCADLCTASLPVYQPSVLFHIAPLPLLPPLLARLPQNTPLQIIAFSSTSRLTKINSPDPKERIVATQLADAETALITECQARNIKWTIFRPTLIYGCGIDKNVTFIAQFIRRFGFFPLIGQGIGLRQPVHADDLAAACVQAYFSPAAINKMYNLSGGQTLSYHDMVIAIFHHLGKKPCIIKIKLSFFKWLTRCLTWLPAYSHLSTAMVARMNQDLCFDHTMAYHDFGYSPRTFSDNDMGFSGIVQKG